MTWDVRHGDCLDVMRGMANASVDAIVTDPPYGLSFMGKEWDHGVPGEPFWAEALRVAKPGAHLVAFGGTRTYHRLACAIEDAGWEIRDCLSWLYGSGFPKSHNGPWGGTALKPAWEPCLLARKPLVGTVAANVAAHGTGALNVDGCRIGTVDDTSRPNNGTALGILNDDGWKPKAMVTGGNTAGRWPANLLLDEDAAAMLDAQSGERPSSSGVRPRYTNNAVYGKHKDTPFESYGDTGGASRFFYCAKASRREREAGLEGMPEVNPFERDGPSANFERMGSKSGPRTNGHPTVKPIALMRWLCRLVTPPGGVVLDPFNGSGSTGCAAVLEGFHYIGIEREAEYVEIAEKRIAHWARQREATDPDLFSEDAA